MPELAFVMARKQNHFFLEIVGALRFELDRLGVASTVSFDGFPEPRQGLVYVLVPPHEYFALRGHAEQPGDELLRRTIFVCAEQPGTINFDQNAALGDRAGALFDINEWAAVEYRRLGVGARHLPLGYSPHWDRFPGEQRRDVDVAFLGCVTERRTRHLASYGRQFARLRTRLVLSDNSGPNYQARPNFLVGEDKLDLLRRSRVLLNLHQGIAPYFEWARVLEAIHCGSVVVTEHSVGCEPLVPGAHMLSGSPEALGLLAKDVVEDDQLRRTLGLQAYELIRERMPLRRSVEQLAEVAAGIDRGARVPRRRPRQVAETPGGRDAWEPPRVEERWDPVAAALKDIRLDMIDLRRELVRTRLGQARGPVPAVRQVWSSPGHSASSPRVSVVTALYNHAAWIGDALTSVDAGRFRDFELIVVDDGSSDASSAAVRRWGQERPEAPLLLLEHPVNRGLPHARNTGLDFARGEYTFVLDADNEVLPNCLDRLAAALDGDPEASFAYGILACFSGDGYTHVVSHFPWEPWRLHGGNYIDAMAMFRTGVLREMGGYTSDRRLYGWEDYDLYCRMAESGRRGAFVPEMVAQYRVSAGSMISLTNISMAAAFAALRERCPRLMTGRL